MHHYIPLTAAQEKTMLELLGLTSVDELFTTIPAQVRAKASFRWVPHQALSEHAVVKHLAELAAENLSTDAAVCFLGGGSYDHFVPSVVRHMLLRSEFYTAYTPYQPEVSQGTLQAIFEFQSVICALTGMELSNASHYDGGTSAAEAALMACSQTGRQVVLVSAGVNPRYRAVIGTYLRAAGLGMELVELGEDGRTPVPDAARFKDVAGLVVAYPNYFGIIEDLARFSAVKGNAVLITVANPVALGLLRPPGELGADICVGDGINLGGSLSYGGPGLGFMAVSAKLMRKIPGRIVGQTVDVDGKLGYVLTLQAREQHIRRQRASSNICSNQALMALAATIHLSLLGKHGLAKVARACYHNAHYLARRISENLGLERAHSGPFFNEFALKLPKDPTPVLAGMESAGVLAGSLLADDYPRLSNAMLVAVTEKRTKDELDRYVWLLGECHAV
ncbi:MAG: aminomethyl-transferring glycine dehydrogenase subunit GcvPA [Candidatus Riflebacteria bacterium]|nr:aminomethyl-transferring glycine dehydrogenase subunit GcvPA [Candidatus Riflebacteria bacterium]